MECVDCDHSENLPLSWGKRVEVLVEFNDPTSKGAWSFCDCFGIYLVYLEPVPKATVSEGRLYYMCNNLRRQVSLG